MKPIVSIIVPVYNTELHLDKCINSVLNQTYKNLELLLIDDGSIDNSGKICDEYAEKDNRIIVRHTKNSGVSVARNTGIKLARGMWLLFLDSDDYLELDIFEYIQGIIKEYQDTDMLIGGFKYVFNSSIEYVDNKVCFKKGVEVIHDYGLWEIKICIGSFVVKKEIVDQHNILFNTKTKYGEDVEFINYCLLGSHKVEVISKYFSSYRIHTESAISKVSFDRYDCYEARFRTLINILNKFPEYKNIESLYKEHLLPEAIIDTTYLLCRNGISIFKIKKFLYQRDYYRIIHSVKGNRSTPTHIKNKINKFIRNPILTWLECFLSTQYYYLRQHIGLKRRLLRWK